MSRMYVWNYCTYQAGLVLVLAVVDDDIGAEFKCESFGSASDTDDVQAGALGELDGKRADGG